MKNKGKNRTRINGEIILFSLITILILLSFISLFIGVNDINMKDILSGDSEKINILLLSRIPRLMSITLSGIALSIAGVIMQRISNNKFVSPTTAATMDSAKFGVLLCMLIFSSAGIMTKMIISLLFSILGTVIFMKILNKIKFKNSVFVPLVGMMVGSVIGAITDFLAYKYNVMQNMTSFLQGDFSMILKGKYEILYFIIPLVIIAFMYAKKFTLVALGEDMATNLGLSYKKVIKIGVIIVSVISALVVVTVGSIPFIGLIVPNIISMFMGDNLKGSLAITALSGGVFVLICDIFGRIIIYPYELPISLTVGVIGSIIFLFLILRNQKCSMA